MSEVDIKNIGIIIIKEMNINPSDIEILLLT